VLGKTGHTARTRRVEPQRFCGSWGSHPIDPGTHLTSAEVLGQGQISGPLTKFFFDGMHIVYGVTVEAPAGESDHITALITNRCSLIPQQCPPRQCSLYAVTGVIPDALDGEEET
jgi:hypothetical protein